MAETVACLHRGKVDVLRLGQATQRLESPYLQQLSATRGSHAHARIVSVTRGRTNAELCYAIDKHGDSSVFVQVPGSSQEQLLFYGVGTQLSELDLSPADEALTCTVTGAGGTSALGVLSDDGKGVRTVTEGDVIDRTPRWVPGGRGEIVYASAGIGRTQAGRAVGRSPFALHRLRFSDNSVEVLMADARYDYSAPVPVSENLLYALRRSYEPARRASGFARLSNAFFGSFSGEARAATARAHSQELVRISTRGSASIAHDVSAFDIAPNEEVVYASGNCVFRIPAGKTTPEPILALEHVEQLVIAC